MASNVIYLPLLGWCQVHGQGQVVVMMIRILWAMKIKFCIVQLLLACMLIFASVPVATGTSIRMKKRVQIGSRFHCAKPCNWCLDMNGPHALVNQFEKFEYSGL